MNVYTDPRLLDLVGAMERLPDLPLDGTELEAGRATGTGGKAASPLAPVLAPAADELCKLGTIADNNAKPDE